MPSDQIEVSTSVEHPLGDGSGVTVIHEAPPATVIHTTTGPAARQVVGLLLFLVGLALAGVTAFRISTTLGIGYVAVVLIIMGAALSYENDATSEEA